MVVEIKAKTSVNLGKERVWVWMGETRVERQFCLRTCLPVDRRDIRQSALCRLSSRLHGMGVPIAGHTGALGARTQERVSRGHMADPSPCLASPRQEQRVSVTQKANHLLLWTLGQESYHCSTFTWDQEPQPQATLCSVGVHSGRVGRPISSIPSHLFIWIG